MVAPNLCVLADAPVPGAANVTVTFGTGFENASSTRTCSAVANPVFTVADWPSPATFTTTDAAPGAFVSANDAAGSAPTVAVTA